MLIRQRIPTKSGVWRSGSASALHVEGREFESYLVVFFFLLHRRYTPSPLLSYTTITSQQSELGHSPPNTYTPTIVLLFCTLHKFLSAFRLVGGSQLPFEISSFSRPLLHTHTPTHTHTQSTGPTTENFQRQVERHQLHHTQQVTAHTQFTRAPLQLQQILTYTHLPPAWRAAQTRNPWAGGGQGKARWWEHQKRQFRGCAWSCGGQHRKLPRRLWIPFFPAIRMSWR
jgi:hypothetical protein